jgi:hypothetical protein
MPLVTDIFMVCCLSLGTTLTFIVTGCINISVDCVPVYVKFPDVSF